MTKKAKPKRAKPSASLAMLSPFAGIGSLVILAILGILGIITIILIAVHPAFRMMFYIVISAGSVYYLGKVIKLKKPLYFLGSFFALITLFIVSPVFMSFFPQTTIAVTGEAALAQATIGESATQQQMVLSIMPVIAAGTLVGIAAGRAKTTIQLILLSTVAVLISIFIVFAFLVI